MKYFRRPGLIAYLILFLVFFWAIYFYFLGIQTQTIYGDDLFVYQRLSGNIGFLDIIDAGGMASKFRPISSLVSYAEVHLFRKWLEDYFIFSVAIQAIIATAFTAIVNIFLRNFFFSSFVSLLVAFSRFSYYSITQLLNGGSMEGLALLFFLAALYNIVVFLTYDNQTHRRGQFYYLMWSILFTNFAIYTHERYIVLFPLIIFFSFLHPLKNYLSRQQKITICLVAAASVFVNFALKTYVYKYPFLVGTGTTSLTHEFHFSKQLGFLVDALASIVQLNYGPGYEMGIEFYDTRGFHLALLVLVVAMLLLIKSWYVISAIRSSKRSDSRAGSNLKLILCLFLILFANLAPSVSTINLELRWLQAAFCVFILILVVMFANTVTRYPKVKNGFFILFVTAFLLSDYNYMFRMNGSFWMKASEWQAYCYKNTIELGFIPKEINTIFYLEDPPSSYTEANVNWVLDYGYFFDFYQEKSKKIVFIDSNMFTNPAQLNLMTYFDRRTEQVIQMTNSVYILTDDVLRKRDVYFAAHGIKAKIDSAGK